MDPLALILSRVQFGFTASFHIIFPAFTIGLAAWLAVLEGLHLFTGKPVYARLFRFWMKIFAVAFGMGVVSGIVMAFEFGTNWSVLSELTGPIQGPLLAYESFTAFALEATFFGIMLFGRGRVPAWVYFGSCCMVALGTTLSAFWILVNNSWMQWPEGYEIVGGLYHPTDWWAILTSDVVWARFPHMLLAAFLTTAFSVAATGAWYLLRHRHLAEGRVMIRMGLGLAAVLVPTQIFYGHLVGEVVHQYQPAKFAAIEGRWETEQPASEILIAIPDPEAETNHLEVSVPYLGSLIATGTWDSRELGIKAFPVDERPPVIVPFFTFRVMVGCGLLMLAIAWIGVFLHFRRRLDGSRPFLWATFLSFPLSFVATLAGWFTAEIGRQPWAVYGQLRTADAVTPTLSGFDVALTLTAFGLVYLLIFLSGSLYIYRLLQEGPEPEDRHDDRIGNPKRPLAVAGATSDAPLPHLTGE